MNPANNTPDINFIPQEVVDRRLEVRNRSSSNRAAIIILIFFIIGSGVAFYFNYSLNSQLDKLDTLIASNQVKVDDLQEFGKHGYKLGIRLQNAQTIIDERANYSYLLDEIVARKPDSIEIADFSATSSRMDFNGTTTFGYPVIAEFQDSLLEIKTEGRNLFKDVKLVSSNFDKSSGLIQFSLEITLSDEIARKVTEEEVQE